MRFVLLHSPFLGPVSWRWVREAIESSSHDVVVPDLRDAVAIGDLGEIAKQVAKEAGKNVTALVGHSGAGFLLPAVAELMEGGPQKLIFVDSLIPPRSGFAALGSDDEFLDHLHAMTSDGLVAKWSTWWPQVMDIFVTNQERRDLLRGELIEVPISLCEKQLEFSATWMETPCCYLLLSESYRHCANAAQGLKWQVIERLGNHLDIINVPKGIAADLETLARWGS